MTAYFKYRHYNEVVKAQGFVAFKKPSPAIWSSIFVGKLFKPSKLQFLHLLIKITILPHRSVGRIKMNFSSTEKVLNKWNYSTLEIIIFIRLHLFGVKSFLFFFHKLLFFLITLCTMLGNNMFRKILFTDRTLK